MEKGSSVFLAALAGALAVAAAISTAGAAPPDPDTTRQPAFPLRASENGRYLVDSAGEPFFYQADTPWMLLFQLTLPEAEAYLADRKARGFSALQIMMTGFPGMENRAGELPFEGDHDLSRPNEAFFAHADSVIRKASEMGMLLMIAPMWSGCCGEGWAGKDKDGNLKPLNAAGPEKAYGWGRWLGERYGSYPNVAWLMGGDHNPDEAIELIRQMARGIHEAAPHQLMAAHNAPDHASAFFYHEEPWLSLNGAYTYREVFQHILDEWQRPGRVRPIFLAESGYERESNDGRGGTPFRMRRQAYGAVLSGALAGHAYGHDVLWPVTETWREALGDVGGRQMTFVRRLFAPRDWWKLEPETADGLVMRGRGRVGEDDFVTAARAGDGTLAVVYIPVSRTITVNLSGLRAPIQAYWFDPTDGSLKPAKASALPETGGHDFTPPERNAAGESDWVLLLEAAR